MTYRELLNYCNANPGCLAGKEQKEIDSIIKHQMRQMQSNENINKTISKNKEIK